MSDSPQTRLDDAVEEVIAEIGPGIITGWVLVAHQANYDDEGYGVSSYPIVLMNGSLPDHVIRGLLEIASDHVRRIGKYSPAIHEHEEIEAEDEDDDEDE